MRRSVIVLGALWALLLALGSFPAAARPGDLDPSFGEGGITVTAIAPGGGDDLVNGLKIQPDQRIVVGGSAHDGASENFALARYTKHGDLDATFGNDGHVVTAVSSSGDDHIFDLALHPDGRIVVGGYADMGLAAGGRNFAVARYLPDGGLDTSFGGGGVVTTGVAPLDKMDSIGAVALQSDGKVVVAGFADMGPGGGGFEMAIVRYEQDGDLDPSFGGGDGVVITAIAAGDGVDSINPNALVVLSDGRILAGGGGAAGAGAGGINFALIRLHSNGDLDESFGSDGKVSTAMSSGDLGDSISGLAVWPDGAFAAGGTARPGVCCDFALALYTADGVVTKKVLTPFAPGSEDRAFDVSLQDDGKIVLGGRSVSSGQSDFALARYNADGTLDDSFGSGGFVTTHIGPEPNFDQAFGLEVAKTGKLLAAGECAFPASGIDFCLAQYKSGPGN